MIDNWYLSEVDDPFTGRAITFQYTPPLNLNVPAGTDLSYNQSNNGSENYVVISYKRSVTTTLELSSITYPDGHNVMLNYSSNQRADYPGEYAVASIDVQYQGRYVSKHLLNTSYFILNRYGNPTTTYQKSVSRLCLRSVQKIGVDLKESFLPYYFDYYTGSNNSDDFVPPPFFYAKDIWGYYNGNNSVPYSSSTPVSLTASSPYALPFDALKGLCVLHTGVTGTYYNPKAALAQNGLLKEIIYPTGGSLTYTYAQNTGSFISNSTVMTIGGVHVAQTSAADGGYSNGCANPEVTNYNYVVNGTGSASSLWGLETPVNYITSNNYWMEEHQTVSWSFTNPLGTCVWHYIYPGILTQYQAVSIEGWQKFMTAIAPALGILGLISTIDDVVNVLGATGVGTVVAVVIDVITVVAGYLVSCPQKTKNTLNTIFYNFDLNEASPLPAQFKRVEITESSGAAGKTVEEFTHGDASDPNLGTDHYYALWAAGSNTAFSAKQRYAPWAYGLPWQITKYDVNNNIIQQIQHVYDFSNAKEQIYDPNTCCATAYTPVANCKCLVINNYSQRSDGWTNPTNYNVSSTFVTVSYYNPNSGALDLVPDIYYIYTGHANMVTTYERTYRTTDNTTFVQKETDYAYGDGFTCKPDGNCQPAYDNYEVTGITTHESNGDIGYKFLYYPGNYNTGLLATLCQKNILSEPVAVQTYLTTAGNVGLNLLSEKVTEYGTLANGDIKPARTLEQRFTTPQNGATVYSGPTTTNYSLYAIPQTYAYDGFSNMVGTKDEELRSVANIYDYNDKYIDASVINCDPVVDKPAYTSFEYDDITRSGWAFSGSGVISKNVPSPTGNNNFPLLSGSLNSLVSGGVLNTGKAYTLSFWASGSGVAVSSGASSTKTGPTYNGFTYYEYNVVAGTSTVQLSNPTSANISIDEVRLYPSSARMKTTAYDALLGKISECDENNRITSYTYDNLGRMQFIKDESGNIVKIYEYNNISAPKQVGCPGSYTNKAVSELIYRGNCNVGLQGQPVNYTVAAGSFTSTISQQDADIQAELYLLTNGPTYANANGACDSVFYNIEEQVTYTTTDCAEGYTAGPVTYTVPAGTYSSIISHADANNQALADIAANAWAYVNDINHMNCTISSAADWEWTPGDPSYCLSVNGQLPPHFFILGTDENPNSSTYNQTQWLDYGPNTACPANYYYNAQQSNSYAPTCSAGYAGNPYTYTVPPGEYSSTVSQAAADQLATNDMNANGQTAANNNSPCTIEGNVTYQDTRAFQYSVRFTNVNYPSLIYNLTPDANSSGTLGLVPEGTYTVYICPINNYVANNNYTVGTQSQTNVVCATFNNVVVGSSGILCLFK